MFFRLALLSIVLSLPLAVSAELPRRGEVTSTEPIELIQDDSSVVTLKVDGEFTKYFLWERSNFNVIELWTDSLGSNSSECSTLIQGRLEKPVSIQVKSSGDEFTITIPAHRTIVYGESECGENESVRSIQIDVKDSERGGIVFDPSGETRNRDEVQASYRSLRAFSRRKLSSLQEQISQRNFERARSTFAELVGNELYSRDLQTLHGLYPLFPISEAPVPAHTSPRYVREEVAERFSVDVASMTTNEFLSLVREFAENPRNERIEGDESYLFRLMMDFNISDGAQVDIYIQALEVRIDLLEQLAISGKEVEFDLVYNAQRALEHLAYIPFSQEEQAERASSYVSYFRHEFIFRYMEDPAWREFVDNELRLFYNVVERLEELEER